MFNDEVGAYKTWTLFLIFVSILILISGVVLLTHKKPEPGAVPKTAGLAPAPMGQRNRRSKKASTSKISLDELNDEEGARGAGRLARHRNGEGESSMLWDVGDASDDESFGEDEDIDHHQNPMSHSQIRGAQSLRDVALPGHETVGLMASADREEDADEPETPRGHKPSASRDPFRDDSEEFGEFSSSGTGRRPNRNRT